MTISLFVRHKVQDFATWQKMYNGSDRIFKETGVIADRVFRDLDDPNVLVVYHEFETRENLRAHMARMMSDEFREGPGEIGGVILDTLEVWTGEEV